MRKSSMKGRVLAILCAILSLLIFSCKQTGSSGPTFGQEFFGEWIRMDTGERWYITGNSISVDGVPTNKNLTLTKTAQEVITVKEKDRPNYFLFASRVPDAVFTARVVFIGEDEGASNSRSARASIPAVRVTNSQIPELQPIIVQPDPDTGQITITNQIPGDPVEIVPTSSEWKDVKVEFIPWADQDMGIIPLAIGVNLKASIRLRNTEEDISGLYADGLSRAYVIEIENIGTVDCVGASYTISWDEEDFSLSSGQQSEILNTIRPKEKREINLSLVSKPIETGYKNKEIKVSILSIDTSTNTPARWEDTVSVNYYKASVPFSFRSQRPVQGVIRTPRNKTYYFKTTGTEGNYAHTINLPWSSDDYIITFLGASVETSSETVYSLAVNGTPSSNWSSLQGEAMFQYEQTNKSSNTAPVLDLSDGKTFMYYLYTEAVQYFRINLGNAPPGKVGDYFQVTFESNGGNYGTWLVSTPTDAELERPEDPIRTGYTFVGWYSDSALTVEYNFSSRVTSSMTLYAKWEAVDYNAILPEMAVAPSGSFLMGSPSTETGRYSDEGPQHTVTLSGFYMGKYAVTQTQFETVMGENPSYYRTAPTGENVAKLPVEQVTWYEAVEFCNKLSELGGFAPVYTISGRTPATGYPITRATVTADWTKDGYRLPTEAEWEYACRAGTTTAYNTGTTANTNTGWYVDNSGDVTHEVGKKPANAWGLFDMHGNVYEWCWDWFGNYSSAEQTNPRGPVSGTERIMRGGAKNSNTSFIRSALRNYSEPEELWLNVGFRVARSDIGIPVTNITFDRTSLDLYIGDTATITATITPDDATNKILEWSLSNSGVVTLSSSGNITAIGIGTVTITAYNGDIRAECTVTVLEREGVTIIPPSVMEEVVSGFVANISLSKSGSNNRTHRIEVAAGYSSYQWYVDGILKLSGSNDAARSFIINAADYALGGHTITIVVYKNGKPYSNEQNFRVYQ